MKLILDDVTKSFDNKSVLNHASFTFEKGKIYGLLGRNGAGKTTLFNCISKELELDSGEINLLDDNNHKNILDYSNVSYIYTQPFLPEFLTGYEFIKFFFDINKNKLKNVLTVDEYFKIVNINEEDRHRLIKTYSHGMKNKIQMLTFIITRPPVILLDEPLTSFDVIVALEIKNLLREIKKDHIIIFSTHILELATDLCDEIVVLNNGELKGVDNDILNSKEFEIEVVNILKENSNV